MTKKAAQEDREIDEIAKAYPPTVAGLYAAQEARIPEIALRQLATRVAQHERLENGARRFSNEAAALAAARDWPRLSSVMRHHAAELAESADALERVGAPVAPIGFLRAAVALLVAEAGKWEPIQ